MTNIIAAGAGLTGLAAAYTLKGKHPDVSITLLEKDARRSKRYMLPERLHEAFFYLDEPVTYAWMREAETSVKAYMKARQLPVHEEPEWYGARTVEDYEKLQGWFHKAKDAGWHVRWVTGKEAAETEPYAALLAAVEIQEASWIDPQRLYDTLLSDVQAAGVDVRFETPVVHWEQTGDSVHVETKHEDLKGEWFLQHTGMESFQMMKSGQVHTDSSPVAFQGTYYKVNPEKADLLNHSLTAVPEDHELFLSVQFMKSFDGSFICGPCVLPKNPAYAQAVRGPESKTALIHAGKKAAGAMSVSMITDQEDQFLKRLRRFLPDLTRNDLIPLAPVVRTKVMRDDGCLHERPMLVNDRRAVHVAASGTGSALSAFQTGKNVTDLLRFSN
ncbi:FAD dependent oxidoreductase [Salsuginibacillus halophilus]|uniref:FAD dependent oxidoreductase n=1 Tax=Salsuginibacillus halophilus TaxID=517424 RepID=A0A2P8HG20_9BACI|nr:FAD-dependent oxidoreductase [Salsuginibacillus halophilus]PSL45146.1 FAD dependent oxidoreductase [Salsuginibacillus halophilus]